MTKRSLSNFINLFNHPLTKQQKVNTFFRFIKFQTKARFGKAVVYPFVNDGKLVVKKGMHGVTRNVYLGLADFQAMSFLLHLLREGDFFADIGANCGVYTVLASAVAKAKTYSIEPNKENFKYLLKNIQLNSIADKVKAINIGAGGENKIVKFRKTKESSTFRAIRENENIDGLDVKLKRVDEIINDKCPLLFKIDTEGYETRVLEGMMKTLENPNLKAIIIELWKRKHIHNRLLSYGFKQCEYEPFSRSLRYIDNHLKNDAIYVRDDNFIKGRLFSAAKFNIFKKSI